MYRENLALNNQTKQNFIAMIPSPQWPGVVSLFRALSMGQIDEIMFTCLKWLWKYIFILGIPKLFELWPQFM